MATVPSLGDLGRGQRSLQEHERALRLAERDARPRETPLDIGDVIELRSLGDRECLREHGLRTGSSRELEDHLRLDDPRTHT